MSALRVLHVIPGQAEASMRYVKRQVASLVREGIVAETMHLSSRTNPGALWRAALDLRRRVRAFRPDVIHAHYGTVTALFCAVTSLVPLVITFRGSDLNPAGLGGRWRSRLAGLFSQLAALRATRIICVSKQLVRRLWWRRERATVIPTGVDTEMFQPRPQADARRELGWSPTETVVLFNAGGNPVTKGLELATKAFTAARALRPDLRLHVISGTELPHRIPLLLNAADCVLVASQHEGSPNIVKEALACNLPVVSVDVGDVAERLAGVTPSRLADRTPSELGAALVAVLAARCRSNGVAAVRDITEERVARRVLDTYLAALPMSGVTTSRGDIDLCTRVMGWHPVPFVDALLGALTQVDERTLDGGTVLEIGASRKSAVSVFFLLKGSSVDVTGYPPTEVDDISDFVIRETRRLRIDETRVRIFPLDVRTMSSRAAYDVIIMKGVLGGLDRHHNLAELTGIVRRCADGLKAGGNLIILDKGYASRMHNFLLRRYGAAGRSSWHYFTETEIRSILPADGTVSVFWAGLFSLGIVASKSLQKLVDFVDHYLVRRLFKHHGTVFAAVYTKPDPCVREITEERVARRVHSTYRDALKVPQTATPDGLRTTSHVPSVTA